MLQPEGVVPQFDSDGRCTTAFNEGDVVGVLVDTFLIRSVLVPCMLVWLPKANYWPTQMPEPSKHEMDDDRQKLLGVDYS